MLELRENGNKKMEEWQPTGICLTNGVMFGGGVSGIA